MAHDFSTVTSTLNSASGHVSHARGLAGSIHDDTTKQAVEALIEAVGGALDAIGFMVDALK